MDIAHKREKKTQNLASKKQNLRPAKKIQSRAEINSVELLISTG